MEVYSPLLGDPNELSRESPRQSDSSLRPGQNHALTHVERGLQQAVLGDYLRGRAFRRFAGTPLPLLVTGFVVSAASNKCRMPCSNSSTALSKAPSCPTRTIATDMCKSNDRGRNTSIVSKELFPAIKRAGSSPTP